MIYKVFEKGVHKELVEVYATDWDCEVGEEITLPQGVYEIKSIKTKKADKNTGKSAYIEVIVVEADKSVINPIASILTVTAFTIGIILVALLSS